MLKIAETIYTKIAESGVNPHDLLMSINKVGNIVGKGKIDAEEGLDIARDLFVFFGSGFAAGCIIGLIHNSSERKPQANLRLATLAGLLATVLLLDENKIIKAIVD